MNDLAVAIEFIPIIVIAQELIQGTAMACELQVDNEKLIYVLNQAGLYTYHAVAFIPIRVEFSNDNRILVFRPKQTLCCWLMISCEHKKSLAGSDQRFMESNVLLPTAVL